MRIPQRLARTLAAGLLCLSAASVHAKTTVAEDASTSSGNAVSVTNGTRIEYLPALRVWWNQAGELLVCRHPGETYTHASKRCEVPPSKDVQVGWVPLKNLQLPGYALSSVQVNETKNGPSLVLYWRPAR